MTQRSHSLLPDNLLQIERFHKHPDMRISLSYLRFLPLLLQEDGSVKMIRRAETPKDYFATFDFSDILKDVKYE